MNKDQFVPLLLALLAVLALAASAATLNSVRHGQIGIGGSDEGIGRGDSGSSFDTGSPQPLNTSVSKSPLLTSLIRVLSGLFMMLCFIVLVIVLLRSGWRPMLKIISLVILSLLLVISISYIFELFSGTLSGQGGLFGEKLSLPSGGSLNSLTEITPPITNEFSTVVLALLGIIVLIAVLVLVRSTGDDSLFRDSDSESDESESKSSVKSAAVGEAAGRAADKIETDTPLSNAIYNAWKEMTTHLDLPRETSTPGEFAEAAVESGMRRDDVDELTKLFEATRYGGIDASEEREQRAVAALRRIEQEYAESGGDR